MFTVDRIIGNIVVLENRETKEIVEVDKIMLPNDIKEKDIVIFKDDLYIVDEKNTERTKKDIRSRFNNLRK